ncbi:MAG: DUF4215 domain-containing protein [bacterium]|nr:DUF4215 domain-containing protein [bacterium]
MTCGNNRLDRGEQCDDNNTWNGDGCSSSCQFEDLCGNNRIEFGETCDDGNTRNGDGCNSSCKLEDIGLRKVITTRKRRPEPLTFRAPPQLPKT